MQVQVHQNVVEPLQGQELLSITLGAPGLTTGSKDATRGSWPYC